MDHSHDRTPSINSTKVFLKNADEYPYKITGEIYAKLLIGLTCRDDYWMCVHDTRMDSNRNVKF